MEQILKGFSWALEGYMPRASQAQRQMLTIEDAERAYQLIPSPPKIKGCDVNDYIRLAQETRELKYIFFYLHEKEWYFNVRVHGFLSREPGPYSPYRLMDLKLACRMEVLRRFQEYDPNRNASFLTYMRHFLTDAMLRNRITEENYSFASLYDYKSARRIMLIYNDCKGNTKAAIRIYAKKYGCTEETAAEKLKAAWEQRNRLLPEINEEDDEEEPYEELLPDEWNYVSILDDGIEAEKIDKAFRSLSFRDQMLLEKRNAICMRCGRVSDMKTQVPFEKLAEKFEGSGASGAEQAYKRAVEKLMLELVKLGQLHCVRIKQTSIQREGKKITAAVYAYQVDNGGAWGEIQFDLEKGTAWVETFAENDPCDTWEITDVAIQAIMKTNDGKLPKGALIPVRKEVPISKKTSEKAAE